MNRKQRRAQGTQSSSSPSIQSADDIPLTQPDRSSSGRDAKAKTLYEIAAEKQSELVAEADRLNGARLDPSNLINVKVKEDGTIVKEDTEEPFDPDDISETMPPLADTFLLAITLALVHFTLEVLTVHQYAQELEWLPIAKRTFLIAFPTLFFSIHLFHGHVVHVPFLAGTNVSFVLKQFFFVAMANYAGCYLIQLTNDEGYYAVMKDAPGIGTIWVWSVIELGLLGALAGVLGPGAYAWWNGYGVI